MQDSMRSNQWLNKKPQRSKKKTSWDYDIICLALSIESYDDDFEMLTDFLLINSTLGR